MQGRMGSENAEEPTRMLDTYELRGKHATSAAA